MKVTLHRAGSMGLMGVMTLKHGLNEVDQGDWDKVKDHPVVKDALRKGQRGGLTLEGVETEFAPTPARKASVAVEVSAPEPAPSSERLSAKETIELVKSMGPDELDELAENDDRKTVLGAIEARRSELLGDEE